MTQNIKEYSSVYATKLNYIMDQLKESPIRKGRFAAIENMLDEPSSTINNWMFNGKLPKNSKKLKISDTLGVSHNYLFNDDIDIENITRPEIHKEGGVYYLPVFNEHDLFKIKKSTFAPVQGRTPFVVPNIDGFIKKFGTRIYAFKISLSNFKPNILDNSTVVYSEHKPEFNEWQILIYLGGDGLPKFKRVIVDDDGSRKLLSYSGNKEIIETTDYTVDFMLFHQSYDFYHE